MYQMTNYVRPSTQSNRLHTSPAQSQPKIHTTTRPARRAACNRNASPYFRSLSSNPLVAEPAEVDAAAVAVFFEVWVEVPALVLLAVFPVATAVPEPAMAVAAGDDSWVGEVCPDVPAPPLPPQVAVILAKGGIPAEDHPQSVTQVEYAAMNAGSQ